MSSKLLDAKRKDIFYMSFLDDEGLDEPEYLSKNMLDTVEYIEKSQQLSTLLLDEWHIT